MTTECPFCGEETYPEEPDHCIVCGAKQDADGIWHPAESVYDPEWYEADGD